MARPVRWLLVLVSIAMCYLTVAVRTKDAPQPILLITNSSSPNRFGGYLAEILRAEGLNQFSVKNLSTVSANDLSSARVVLLAETALTARQANLFTNYVSGGGRFITMRPDAQLESALGLTPAGSLTTEGYFAINAGTPFADGLVPTTLPFHGVATNYTPNAGTTVLAMMYSNATTATIFPAVMRSGRTVTWAYDLARSIVYTRQGNPANAGNRDGMQPYRTADLFFKAIDLDKVHIPYADVQMRMLSRVISDLLADEMPLPQLWYFPGSNKTLMIITSDSHANPQSYFDRVISSVEARGGHVSLYVNGGSSPSKTSAALWTNNGHEVGMHPVAFQSGLTFDQALLANRQYFTLSGYGSPSPTTRMHQVEWQGWVDAAKIASKFGVKLDTSFYTWGPAVTYPDGRQAHGYINGSGLPMRFVDDSGTVLPVYQQVTSLIDEQLAVGDFAEHLTPAQSLAVSRQLIDESQSGSYAAVTTQFHVDYFAFGEVQPWAEGTMDYARSLGIPMWTAARWLNYTTTRARTTLTDFVWDAKAQQLSFRVTVPGGSESQSLALPGDFGGLGLTTVRVDGVSTVSVRRMITARSVDFVTIAAGSHAVSVTYASTVPRQERLPVAADDTAAASEGQSVTIPVLTNDSIPGVDAPTIVSTSADPNAVIKINGGQTVTYSPNIGTCGLDSFTYTISDGHGGTSTASVSVAVTCHSSQVTQAGLPGFGGVCAVRTNSLVTGSGSGDVRLSGTLGNDYTLEGLDRTNWAAGTWSGGSYAPSAGNGVLSIGNSTGAWVRSTTNRTIGSIEFTARFSPALWEHIGWGSLNFDGGYLIFSTFNSGTNLFARSRHDGSSEQQTDLGPIPVGFHTYRIDRQSASATSNVISYYVDGVLRVQHTVGPLGPMYVYQSHDGGARPTLDIDGIWTYPPYVGSGTYQGCPMDSGQASSSWTKALWTANVPAGTTLELRTRTSNDSSTWSAWSAPLRASGQAVTSPPGRYVEYLLEMASSDSNESPIVQNVTLQYQGGPLPQDRPTVAGGDPATAEGRR